MFKNLFSKSEEANQVDLNIHPLQQEQELETIMADRSGKKFLLFKHSTRCGISTSVKRRFEKKLSQQQLTDYYLLDLLNFRSLSNKIAEDLEIIHQSPQLIIIQDGKVLRHASHYQILELEL